MLFALPFRTQTPSVLLHTRGALLLHPLTPRRLPRQLLDAVHDHVRARLRLAVLPDEPVDLAALRLLGERAREAAAREGRPGDGADAEILNNSGIAGLDGIRLCF